MSKNCLTSSKNSFMIKFWKSVLKFEKHRERLLKKKLCLPVGKKFFTVSDRTSYNSALGMIWWVMIECLLSLLFDCFLHAYCAQLTKKYWRTNRHRFANYFSALYFDCYEINDTIEMRKDFGWLRSCLYFSK